MELTKFIREKDVVKEWPLSKSTLIRARKRGLRFYRIGAYVCYRPEDLEGFFVEARSWSGGESKSKGGQKQ